MIITQPRSYFASLGFGFFTAFAFLSAVPFSMASDRQLATLPWIVLALFLVIYAEFVRDSRSIEIDKANNQVIEKERSAFFFVRERRYPLDLFTAVISFIPPGRFTRNLVELVTREGGEALNIAAFPPSMAARSFWSSPTYAEAPQAEALRRNLVENFGFLDRGFLGSRFTGAYVSSKSCLTSQSTRTLRDSAAQRR